MLIHKFFEIATSQFVNELIFSRDSQMVVFKFTSLQALQRTIFHKNSFWFKRL